MHPITGICATAATFIAHTEPDSIKRAWMRERARGRLCVYASNKVPWVGSLKMFFRCVSCFTMLNRCGFPSSFLSTPRSGSPA